MPDKCTITNILLIDDDEDDYYLFREALAEVSPHTRLSWLQRTEKIIEEVASARPSLIVIDFKLPGENGIEVVQHLKAHPSCKHIPVIMWSTSGILSQVVNAYKAGVQQYMEKPWDLKILAKKLKVILKKKWSGPDPGGGTLPLQESLQFPVSPEQVLR